MTEAEVEAFLVQLSELEGRPAPVVTWVDQGGSRVRPGRRNQIELDRRILESRDDARFTAAHEFGHITLGHTSARRVGGLVVLYVSTLVATMAITTWLAIALTGAEWTIPIAFVLGGIAWLPVQRQLSLRFKQPMERAADLFAARAGAPLTQALVTRYEGGRTATSRALSYVFPLHPSWADRAATTAAAIRAK